MNNDKILKQLRAIQDSGLALYVLLSDPDASKKKKEIAIRNVRDSTAKILHTLKRIEKA